MCYLMNSISTDLELARARGENGVTAKNQTQVYRASVLVKAYGEYNALRSFRAKLSHNPTDGQADDPEMARCLKTVYLIYAQFSLEKHLIYFYEGAFVAGSYMVAAIRDNLLANCAHLKRYAVIVADALSPPDFILNSVIAKADGKLYQNLQTEFMTTPGALERVSWWKSVLPVRKSKL